MPLSPQLLLTGFDLWPLDRLIYWVRCTARLQSKEHAIHTTTQSRPWDYIQVITTTDSKRTGEMKRTWLLSWFCRIRNANEQTIDWLIGGGRSLVTSGRSDLWLLCFACVCYQRLCRWLDGGGKVLQILGFVDEENTTSESTSALQRLLHAHRCSLIINTVLVDLKTKTTVTTQILEHFTNKDMSQN